MEEMTGACLYCGQTRLVEAADQNDADLRATEQCQHCDNPVKRKLQLGRNIDSLLGPTAKEYGMIPLGEDTIDKAKEIGDLIVDGEIEAVTFRVADSSITIKNTNKGVSVYRNKTISAKLEA